MKTIIQKTLAIVGMTIMILFLNLGNAQAQGVTITPITKAQFDLFATSTSPVFCWLQDYPGAENTTTLQAGATTDTQEYYVALGTRTSYTQEFTVSLDKKVQVSGHSIGAHHPNPYTAGPLDVQYAGKTLFLAAWFNPGSPSGSIETITGLSINDVYVPTVNWRGDVNNPFFGVQIDSLTPITKIGLSYTIDGVVLSGESGIGVIMPQQVPEPGTVALFGIGAIITGALIRRKRP